MFSIIHPYLSQLFPHFVFFFSPSFHPLLATRHILQFTMFDSISLQPARNIMGDKKNHFIAHGKRRNVAVIITKTNTLV